MRNAIELHRLISRIWMLFMYAECWLPIFTSPGRNRLWCGILAYNLVCYFSAADILPSTLAILLGLSICTIYTYKHSIRCIVRFSSIKRVTAYDSVLWSAVDTHNISSFPILILNYLYSNGKFRSSRYCVSIENHGSEALASTMHVKFIAEPAIMNKSGPPNSVVIGSENRKNICCSKNIALVGILFINVNVEMRKIEAFQISHRQSWYKFKTLTRPRCPGRVK